MDGSFLHVCTCTWVHVHLKAGHPGLLVMFSLCVCTVRVWCIGSGFSFYSSSMTNLASVLYT